MKVPDKGQLMHFKIQAVMREHGELSNIEYKGCINGEHIYDVGGHLVPAQNIDEFERVD
tara:strand:- start:137 stop:313 length:177 start_codon:yes stop_codon:yes gene_type:complete